MDRRRPEGRPIEQLFAATARRIRGAAAVHPTACGIGMMVAAGALFAGMHATVRHLAAEIDPLEIAFFRNLFGFLALAPWLLRAGPAALRTERFPLHLGRSILNSASMMAWFTALGLLPLADATALSLAGPLFVTLGAILLFGETVRAERWAALGVGIAGALILIRPGFGEIELGVVLVLASTLSVSGSKLIVKSLARTEGTATIVAYMSLLMTPITLIPALFVWQWPTAGQFALLAAIGGLGSLGHLCFVQAYKFADVSVVEPAIFTRLIWAALIGFLLFGEVPGVWVWIGGGAIVAATSYIARREAMARDRPGRDRPGRSRA